MFIQLHVDIRTFVYTYINNYITHLLFRCIRECGFPKAGMGTEFQTGAKREVSTNIYAYACANTNTYILTSKPAKGQAGRGNIGKHDASFTLRRGQVKRCVVGVAAKQCAGRQAYMIMHVCMHACMPCFLRYMCMCSMRMCMPPVSVECMCACVYACMFV